MLKIVFSYPTNLPNEIVLVNALLQSDVDYFHIRKPHFEEQDLENYIEQLDEVYRYKILIHNYYRLANKYNLGGIHLNQKGMAELRTEEESDKCFIEPLLLKNREILVNGKAPHHISYAAHSLTEIETLEFNADYIVLSPIFDSISKINYQSNFTDRTALRLAISKSKQKVIALGGVEIKHEEELKSLGFAGYARLGDYWQKYIPESKEMSETF